MINKKAVSEGLGWLKCVPPIFAEGIKPHIIWAFKCIKLGTLSVALSPISTEMLTEVIHARDGIDQVSFTNIEPKEKIDVAAILKCREGDMFDPFASL